MLPSLIVALGLLAPFVSAAQGDRQCMRHMCVSATVDPDGDKVTYHMDMDTPLIKWAAIGFGTTMVGTPLVIATVNSTNGYAISQRMATDHVEPNIDPYPPRVATLYNQLIAFDDTKSSLAFTIPANSDTQQYIIWAYSHTPITDDGHIVQHCDKGRMILNLAGTLPDNDAAPPTTPVPLLLSEKQLLAHAALMTAAFLFVLPMGALTARLLRTFVPGWVNPHALFQFGIALPLVTAGLVMIKVANRAAAPAADAHRALGIAILVIYYLQVSLGIFILSYQPKGWPTIKGRAIQNYFHACFGLSMLVLAFYQIYSGISIAWTASTGRDVLPVYWNVWTAFVVIFAVFYIGGLTLLPRQYRQESSSRKKGDPEPADTDVLTSKPLMHEKSSSIHEKTPSMG